MQAHPAGHDDRQNCSFSPVTVWQFDSEKLVAHVDPTYELGDLTDTSLDRLKRRIARAIIARGHVHFTDCCDVWWLYRLPAIKVNGVVYYRAENGPEGPADFPQRKTIQFCDTVFDIVTDSDTAFMAEVDGYMAQARNRVLEIPPVTWPTSTLSCEEDVYRFEACWMEPSAVEKARASERAGLPSGAIVAPSLASLQFRIGELLSRCHKDCMSGHFDRWYVKAQPSVSARNRIWYRADIADGELTRKATTSPLLSREGDELTDAAKAFEAGVDERIDAARDAVIQRELTLQARFRYLVNAADKEIHNLFYRGGEMVEISFRQYPSNLRDLTCLQEKFGFDSLSAQVRFYVAWGMRDDLIRLHPDFSGLHPHIEAMTSLVCSINNLDNGDADWSASLDGKYPDGRSDIDCRLTPVAERLKEQRDEDLLLERLTVSLPKAAVDRLRHLAPLVHRSASPASLVRLYTGNGIRRHADRIVGSGAV